MVNWRVRVISILIGLLCWAVIYRVWGVTGLVVALLVDGIMRRLADDIIEQRKDKERAAIIDAFTERLKNLRQEQ